MSNVKEWLDEATPDRREVTVCLDRRLVSELVSLKEIVLREREESNGRQMLGASDGYEKRVAELEDRIRAKSRTLVFEGIGWGRWRDVIAKNPPAEDQAEVFERAVQLGFMPHAVENIGYNAETFIPAAISASCVEPGMTVEEATRLLFKAPPGVIERVWTAVMEVNFAGATDPFVGPASEDSSDAAKPSARKSRRP